MTIKFVYMDPEVQKSILRVVECKLIDSCQDGAAVVHSVLSAYACLYEQITTTSAGPIIVNAKVNLDEENNRSGKDGRCGHELINNIAIHDGGPK